MRIQNYREKCIFSSAEFSKELFQFACNDCLLINRYNLHFVPKENRIFPSLHVAAAFRSSDNGTSSRIDSLFALAAANSISKLNMIVAEPAWCNSGVIRQLQFGRGFEI
ncbi:hypothetical protein IEQ34_011178 [Dendrobium chrysotoxum]|uniref:Uncharacterized protein n=1 Tax=Dendrobium chrysotoxum TaxID=161865 RepID=A0AAV7GFD9_DENCH|nr:hypothetical protein IEQ34_011178 [Dendrobium chrysotoxum]